MKKYIKTVMLGMAVGVGCMTTSCEIDYSPKNSFTATNFWGDQSQFEGNILALSTQFRGFATDLLFNAGEIRSGVFEYSTVDGSGTANAGYFDNVYNVNNTQFTNFGGWYGMIANLNELIYRCDERQDKLTEEVKNGLLGMAHGWRAYCYFQMYRMWGGVVIRETPDVQLGNYNATELYKARATAEQTLEFIKSDIKKSLDYFNSTSYVYNKNHKDYYWSKAATEMLAGEVYLWSGKVETEDHKANAADVATAATYFDNVINNYGYALQPDFFSIWTTPHNPENIFAFCFSSESDNAWYTIQSNLMWARITGNGYNAYWSIHDKEGWGKIDGTGANRFGRWHDTATGTTADVDFWQICNFGVMRYTYKNSLYYQMDAEDSRKDQFYPCWYITDEERTNEVMYIEDFDPTQYKLAGSYIKKIRPKMVSSSTYYTFANDMPVYRLALAHLYAAECANYAGDAAKFEHHINIVRARAYGDNWDVAKFGAKSGSFRENENIIMREKDKEFMMEGQRWFDLRRLTAVKGGTQKDHFVFQPEGCYGFGLDTAANPWMVDINGNLVETNVPVLNGTTQDEHLLLWPINQGLLQSDPEIKQNPGY